MTIMSEQPARYTAMLTFGEDGWVTAQVVEVPEAISQGRTAAEAKTNVIEALVAALEWREEDGAPLPTPVEVTLEPISAPAS